MEIEAGGQDGNTKDRRQRNRRADQGRVEEKNPGFGGDLRTRTRTGGRFSRRRSRLADLCEK